MPRKSKRQEAAEQKRKLDGMFHEYHELGAKTHGFAWMRMNQLMLTAARLCDIRYENQPYKTLLTVCAMKALNQMPGESLADRPAASQGAARELNEFIAELQHFSGATCFENEGQVEEERDPDNCQKCRLEDIAEALAASQPPQELEGLRLKALERGLELVESAFAHVSHGGPTRADAEKWIREARDALGK